MSVNRISHSQENRAEAVHSPNSEKSPSTKTKAEVDGQKPHEPAKPAPQTQPTATADNNAGREQSQQQNFGNDTNGTRVNVFA